ncbi:MAG: hypothetical protein IM638_12975 [Bacteroidetes bacterium]|nr:hypothetical protein [Bacteroidota bacterium]
MTKLKSNFERTLQELQEKGIIGEIIREDKDQIMKRIEEEMHEFRLENQKRIHQSEKDMASIILNA